MKKILFAVALTITLGFTASAQFNINTDSFFNDWEQSDRLDVGGFSFVLPSTHGFGVDTPSAPLGRVCGSEAQTLMSKKRIPRLRSE